MPRYTAVLFALATLSATTLAQSADQAGPGSSSYTQSQAAPIQRNAAANPNREYMYRASLPAGQDLTTTSGTASAQVAPGVLVRIGPNSTLRSVPTEANGVELRLERGRANVSVDHPSDNTLILVDLPGGQADLVREGLYTFNAETNTMRVLHGEADAFVGAASANGKPIKVSQDQEYVFSGSHIRATNADRSQITADLLPWTGQRNGNGGGSGYASGYPARGDGYYSTGPYGDGYAAPYYGYGWGYPYYGYGWGYPYWGYGYPIGFGIGFGYGGYYRGGYYRGGYGFRGRR